MMTRVSSLGKKYYSRITKVVNGSHVLFVMVPVNDHDGMLKTLRERRKKILELEPYALAKPDLVKHITNLEAKVQYYKREVKKRIKEADRLIEKIDIQLALEDYETI